MSKTRPYPHVVIRASAGTGKTYQLAVRFIGLLAAGARPDEILATTFTRKAAGEILDRVLFWLAEAAADDAEREKLRGAIGAEVLTREQCRGMLAAMVRRLHALRVGTLDSYFLQVAVSFGHELGLPPGWSICDELIDAVLREEATELVLSRGKLADLLTLVHSLTKGAASRSVSRLVQETVGSLFELYRETSPEAWRKIAVCKGLTAEEAEEALVALAAVELGDNKRMAAARTEDMERFRAGNWEAFIGTGLASKVLSGECAYYKKPLPPEMVKIYQRLLTHVESILVGQVARQTEATHDLLVRFAEHYHALQLDERALRFSDVTSRLAGAAQAVGPELMAYRLDGGIRHVLLDEFQDTSPSQWRVLLPLAQGVTRAGSGTFFCVGDAKQAIYGWRGGVAEIFDALDGQLEGLAPRSLAKSYRSSQPVIDAVNGVFQNLTKHPNLDKLAEPVGRWQGAFAVHSTERTQLAGHVKLMVAPEAAEGEDQALEVFELAAERIEECLATAPGASIGVLVRTNAAVGKLIYLLRSRGIEASEEGGNPLVDSPAVELILSVLRIADHPADLVARFHVATSPLAGQLELPDYQNHAAARRLSYNVRRKLMDEGYGETVFGFARQLAASCDQRDLSRLQQLVELAYEYQPASTLRTGDFLRLVATRRIADPQAANVRVMTIHQAKGLEFDVVFLPELEHRLVGQPDRFVAGRPGPTELVNVVCRLADKTVRQFFPPELEKLFVDDMCLEVSESLCVLYVAMTRAVHALYMIVAPAKGNEKNMPKTFAGMLRATLAAGKAATSGAMLYEEGDGEWFGTLRVERVSELFEPEDTRDAYSMIRLAPAAKKRERGLERTSPSALEGGTRLLADSVLSARSDEAFGVGTFFHAWLAEIEWLDDGQPGDEKLRRIAAGLRGEIGSAGKDVEGHIARFRKQLAAPTIKEALSRKSYPPGTDLTVWRERPFALRTENGILTGSMDRLVVVKNGGKIVAADVLDFKTDEIAAGDEQALAAKVNFYRPQVEAYREAAGKMLKLEPALVGARLVFLSAGMVRVV